MYLALNDVAVSPILGFFLIRCCYFCFIYDILNGTFSRSLEGNHLFFCSCRFLLFLLGSLLILTVVCLYNCLYIVNAAISDFQCICVADLVQLNFLWAVLSIRFKFFSSICFDMLAIG